MSWLAFFFADHLNPALLVMSSRVPIIVIFPIDSTVADGDETTSAAVTYSITLPKWFLSKLLSSGKSLNSTIHAFTFVTVE